MSNLLNEEEMMVPMVNFIQATRRFEEGAGEQRQGRGSRGEEVEVG